MANHPTIRPPLPAFAARRAGVRTGAFTLLELLTVIIIIAILAGILLPVISKVRQSAYAADTKNEIASIQNAIERYYQDFQAYPGPLSNAQVGLAPSAVTTVTGITVNPTGASQTITGSENLVLGLLGGLKYDSSSSSKILYDKDLVGKGPLSLNASRPRGYTAYLENSNISNDYFKDDAGSASDTNIPEFVDRFPHPMPILYLRANVGASGVISATTSGTQAQYDLSQIIGYTKADAASGYIGEGRKLKVQGLNDLTTPPAKTIDPRYYFVSPNDPELSQTTPDPTKFASPKQKDGYILISAGIDRVYGTKDDVASFGTVEP